jgi:hypothetical protein
MTSIRENSNEVSNARALQRRQERYRLWDGTGDRHFMERESLDHLGDHSRIVFVAVRDLLRGNALTGISGEGQ